MINMLPNFQFLIYNFKSIFNNLILKIYNSIKISNFKFQIISILFLLSLISHFSPLTSPAFAQAQSENSGQAANYPVMEANPDVPNTMHNWTQGVMIETMSALTCQLAGIDPINPQQGCLGIDSSSGKIGFLPSPQAGGAIGFVGNMISVLYTPPLHTGDYVKYLSSNFGISKKSYAQVSSVCDSSKSGFGFCGLMPLLEIWKAFRNVVYLLLVIVFVGIGLAIMLRIKIDPRTVMSIQNQIPKIIIGIIMITFSFAVAGFMIDFMYLLIYLSLNVISTASPTFAKQIGEITTLSSPLSVVQSLTGFGKIITSPAVAVGGIVGGIVHNIVGGIPFIGGILGGIAGVLAWLIIAIAVLVALIRLWFSLLVSYIYILLGIALAPFWIIGGMVPGSQINISGWFRDLGSNLLAFPVIIALFSIGQVFTNAFGQPEFPQPFVPPMVSGGIPMKDIGAIIGLGFILTAPNALNLVKAALKAPKIETGIGKAIAPGLGAPGRIVGGALSTALTPHYNQEGTKFIYPGGTIGKFLRGFGFVKG